jgi:hypothetical protein
MMYAGEHCYCKARSMFASAVQQHARYHCMRWKGGDDLHLLLCMIFGALA